MARMIKSIAAMTLLCTVAACTQEQAAPVDYKGGFFYGREGVQNRKGEEQPKYSANNPAFLDPSIEDKYTAGKQTYGLAAEVDTVGSTDLMPPSARAQAPVVEVPVRSVAVAPAPAPVEYIQKPLPPKPVTAINLPAPIAKPIAPIPEIKETVEVIKPAAVASKTPHFIWPVKGKVLSKFGQAKGKTADGVNISARQGEPIRSSADGVVIYSGSKLKSYGNLVVVKHSDGFVSAYGHANDLVVSKGDYVVAGQLIGFVGKTGAVDKPQLHFAIRKDKKPVNPSPLLHND